MTCSFPMSAVCSGPHRCRQVTLLFAIAWAVFLLPGMGTTFAADDKSPSLEQTRAAMLKATTFFRKHAAAGGGYVYRLSADLKKREGEGRVGSTTAWLQPPGTPTVGMAYLEAYRLSGEQHLRAAALETADALLRGQLVSGGWYHRIEFAPRERVKFAYRVEVESNGEPKQRTNVTTFDDDKSQAAARFLIQLDKTLEFRDQRIHEATLYALDRFVRAQYPNGAWPQRYSRFPAAAEFPVRRAAYPERWSRKYSGGDYKGFYTLNDNTISDVITTMFDAWDVYRDRRYLNAARRGGDFFLLAQMPEPQPGWAQQYNRKMHPAWARKFEPPAVTGGESQGVMRTLLLLYRRTADRKYLAPLPAALKYYKNSRLPDGRLARFYELNTNRPLYFTKDYRLTYSDADMPTHYGFQVGSGLDAIEREYQRVLKLKPDELWQPKKPQPPKWSRSLARRAAAVIAALDERGAWVEDGKLRYHGDDDDTRRVIQSRTFANNLVLLARYAAVVGNTSK